MVDPQIAGAVVVAAGDGVRLGRSTPKALIEVGGVALVVHSVRTLVAAGLAAPVVVYPPDAETAVRRVLADEAVGDLVAGGPTRTDSVRRGVAALPDATEIVAIHDAARPLVPVAVVRRVLAAMQAGVLAAAPGIPVADTLKRVVDGRVHATVDRQGLMAVQTPQVFVRDVLATVLAAGDEATDELALVERFVDDGRLTGEVVVVAGSPFAHKVTHPDDLELVAALVPVTGRPR